VLIIIIEVHLTVLVRV